MKELAEGVNTKAVPYLRRIGLGIRRIAELGAEMSETTMNLVLEKPSTLCEMHLDEGSKTSEEETFGESRDTFQKYSLPTRRGL